LYQIQQAVRLRAEQITAAHGDWPCRKGCDECCRRLASAPRVSSEEWRLIDAALNALPAETAKAARRRIEDSAHAERPVVCPLLDTHAGACLIYAARPVACRTYGFYAERQFVLGCARIEALGQQRPDVVWGNHEALEAELSDLGPAAGLAEWLEAGRRH
jgi:Fe-S-cluster containining protein